MQSLQSSKPLSSTSISQEQSVDICVSIGNIARDRRGMQFVSTPETQLDVIRFDNVDTRRKLFQGTRTPSSTRDCPLTTRADANIANHNQPTILVICLAALAMRRRSRSVPMHMSVNRLWVLFMRAQDPQTDPPKDPTVAKHATSIVTRASGRNSRSDKRRCERQGTPNFQASKHS